MYLLAQRGQMMMGNLLFQTAAMTIKNDGFFKFLFWEEHMKSLLCYRHFSACFF